MTNTCPLKKETFAAVAHSVNAHFKFREAAQLLFKASNIPNHRATSLLPSSAYQKFKTCFVDLNKKKNRTKCLWENSSICFGSFVFNEMLNNACQDAFL